MFFLVDDQGCGMSEEVKKRIFDPYFSTKDKDKGTGLGMSTVQDLAKKMQAEILIESQEGEGTSISLVIQKEEQKEATITNYKDTSLMPFIDQVVLLVDDNEDLLHAMAQTLESYGAHVIAAINGNEALAKLENYRGDIQCLITDIMMPDLNGFRLSELIRSIRPNTKIVLLTGHADHKFQNIGGIPEGAKLMHKPIDYERAYISHKSKRCHS